MDSYKLNLGLSQSTILQSFIDFYLGVHFIKEGKVNYFIALCVAYGVDGLSIFIMNLRMMNKQRFVYCIMYALQIDIVYVLIHKQVPIPISSNLLFRIRKIGLLIMTQMIFFFGLDTLEVKDSELAISAYPIFILLIYTFLIWTIVYDRIVLLQFNNSISEGIFNYIPYYLSISALVAIQNDLFGVNLGFVALGVILINNLISLLANRKEIRDSGDYQGCFIKYIRGLFTNQYPRFQSSYGGIGSVVISNYMNQLIMFILLIVFGVPNLIKDIVIFTDLTIMKQIILVNFILALILSILYLSVYLSEFYRYIFISKRYYISDTNDLVNVTNYLNQRHFKVNEITIIFKTEVKLINDKLDFSDERSTLLKDKCTNQYCIVQYNFLKSISYQLKSIRDITIFYYELDLCQDHLNDHISNDQQVCNQFVETKIMPLDDRYKAELIIERLSNGFLLDSLTDKLICSLQMKQQMIIRNILSNLLSMNLFLKSETDSINVLPQLVLFDLYSIDS